MEKNWTAIILTAIVVAFIASLITANITGNVIKVKLDKRGEEVYTKKEVDSKLKDFTTNRDVLDMLSSCSAAGTWNDGGSKTCNNRCDEFGKDEGKDYTCIATLVKDNEGITDFVESCSSKNGLPYNCYCCSS